MEPDEFDEEITIMLHRKIAQWISPLFLKMGISPNNITIIGFILSLVSGICFTFGTHIGNIFAVITLEIAFIFDVLDGIVARKTDKATPFGGWLDGVLDRIKEVIVVISICVGYINSTELLSLTVFYFQTPIWFIATITIAFIFILEYSLLLRREIIVKEEEVTFIEKKSVLKRIAEPSFGKTIVIICFFSIINFAVGGLIAICFINLVYIIGIILARGFFVTTLKKIE